MTASEKRNGSEHFQSADTTRERSIYDLAKAVCEARKRRLPYKILELLTGYSRTRLFQLKKLGENL